MNYKLYCDKTNLQHYCTATMDTVRWFLSVLIVSRVTSTLIQQYYHRRPECPYKLLNGLFIYKTINSDSLLSCAAECSRVETCVSFNFLDSKACQLSHSKLDSTCSNGSPNIEGSYFERDDNEGDMGSGSPGIVCLNGGYLVSNTCRCVGGYIGQFCERIMEDCTEGAPYYPGQFSTFLIHPKMSPEPFLAVCRMEYGFRTYIKIRHKMGNLQMNRDWESYKNGFGNINETNTFDRNLWLGNEKIYYLTNSKTYRLVIQLVEQYYSQFGEMEFVNFIMQNETYNYSMSYSHSYSYPLSLMFDDCMNYLNGSQFSTFDSDNDESAENCASKYGSGWWFKNCTLCNPNGRLWPSGTNVRAGVDDEFFWDTGLPGWSAWAVSMWLRRL